MPKEVDNDIDATIGANVHALIWRSRRYQTELAQALYITPSVLSKKIHGESAWSARQVAVAAHWLGVPISTLYGEDEGNEPNRLPAVRREGIEPPTRWLRAVPDLERRQAAENVA